MLPSTINALGVRLAKSAAPAADDLDALTKLQDEYMQPLEETGAILREKLNLTALGTFPARCDDSHQPGRVQPVAPMTVCPFQGRGHGFGSHPGYKAVITLSD